jgi:integrase
MRSSSTSNTWNRRRLSIPINELVAKYLAYKAQDTHLSHEHIDDLTSRYARFCQDLGTKGTRELTVDDVQDWLFELPLTALSKNNFRARLFALFKFAVKKKLMDKNPCSDIDLLKVKKPRIEIFTPDQLAAVLDHADPELIPAIVIGCFSGVRTKERSLLEWKDIDIKRGTITVEDEDCKTAMNRTIKMEPCLQAWLAPYQGRTGAVFAGNDQKLCRQIRQTCKAAGLNKAPKNGCRHSFATYHVAKYENSEAVRAILGHKSVGQLYANYRAMGVKPDQADLYFNIFPPQPAQNVVSMTA